MKIRRDYGTVAFALAGSLLFLANTTAATADDPKNPLVLESYRSFFIGGERADAGGGNVKLDGHAYVEAFIPQRKDGAKKKAPIVMMHISISATIFLESANGTEGAWAPFVRAGHPVYIVDPPGTGRAPRDIALLDDLGDIGQSNSRNWASWKNGPAFGQLGFNPDGGDGTGKDSTPHASPMNQLPCDANDHVDAIDCDNPDPEGVNQFIGHFSVLRTNVPGTPFRGDPVRDAAVIALLEKIGEPVIWMGWSRGGLLGQRLIIQRPELFAAFTPFEGCADNDVDIDDFLDALIDNNIPFLHVNPDYAREVFPGNPRYLPSNSRCVSTPSIDVAQALRDRGGTAETIYAPDVGVSGNGHSMMFQNNIREYAQIYLDWFKKNLN